MAVFNVGDFTVYPHVTEGSGIWTAHFSITTPDGNGGTARFGLTQLHGGFATEGEAMEAARTHGREAARQLVDASRIEPGD